MSFFSFRRSRTSPAKPAAAAAASESVEVVRRRARQRLIGAVLLLTLGVIARIHWQALRLLVKRVPFFGKAPATAVAPAIPSR